MKIIRYIILIFILGAPISVFAQTEKAQNILIKLALPFHPIKPSDVIFTKSFCEILGMLDEYIGRPANPIYSPNSDLVEFFYSTKEDNKSATHFAELIDDYEMEIGESFNLKIQAHNIFYSKSLKNLINCLYIPAFKQFDELNYYTLDRKYILDLPKDLRYAYLKGAYYRYGSGNCIYIVNGINKLTTLAYVMESLGMNEIKIYRSALNTVPRDFVLTFQIDSTIIRQIDYKETEPRKEYFHNQALVNYKDIK